MGTTKTDAAAERKSGVSAAKRISRVMNLLGLITAFGIGFGGLFLVQYRLEREEDELLRSAGEVEIPVHVEVETADAVQVDTEPEKLTDAQLYQAVEWLDNGMESYPHEPWEGQLSMAQALECGDAWLREFLLPRMGADGDGLKEQSVDCYLWTWNLDSEGRETNSLASYWSVWIYSPELEAELTLQASSGQVLRAIVSSSVLTEYQEKDQIREILDDYADSFGLSGGGQAKQILDGGYGEAGNPGVWMQRSVGEEGVYASVTTNSFVISKADAATLEYTEIFSMNLSLGAGQGFGK